VGSVSSLMGDHHSFLQPILGLKYKRIQHIFDQIFHAFMGVKVKVSSKTAIQVLTQATYLRAFAQIFQAFNAGI
jgi:hypothetical protein